MVRIDKSFYSLHAPEMARALIGKKLCVKLGNGVMKHAILETECYYGFEDSACHAHRGKTERNKVMFEAGGIAYIYLCYGLHNMLNIVSGEKDFPEAVLIRGVEGYMGPGKLTKALGITRDYNGEDMINSERLWLEEGDVQYSISASERIGIDYADEEDRKRLWRFSAV